MQIYSVPPCQWVSTRPADHFVGLFIVFSDRARVCAYGKKYIDCEWIGIKRSQIPIRWALLFAISSCPMITPRKHHTAHNIFQLFTFSSVFTLFPEWSTFHSKNVHSNAIPNERKYLMNPNKNQCCRLEFDVCLLLFYSLIFIGKLIAIYRLISAMNNEDLTMQYDNFSNELTFNDIQWFVKEYQCDICKQTDWKSTKQKLTDKKCTTFQTNITNQIIIFFVKFWFWARQISRLSHQNK